MARNVKVRSGFETWSATLILLGLTNEGIRPSPSLIGAVSTPTGECEIDAYLEALHAVLARS